MLSVLVAAASMTVPTLGTAWYPEAWPKERWTTDLEMMRAADIMSVRIGEFNWAGFEPSEGMFDFAQFKEVLDLLSSRGLTAVMCTATAAPPRWFFEKYPEARKVWPDGSSPVIDVRRQYCFNNPDFRRRAAALTEAMAKTLGGHPAICAWQLDNELSADSEGGHCTCRHCATGFQAWLRKKYGTLERLNKAWNGVFWSNAVQGWEQIRPPFHQIVFWNDYTKFQSDAVVGFLREQEAIVRRYDRRPVCYNTWGNFQCDLDIPKMVETMDYACCDSYVSPDYLGMNSSMWDLYRSLKRKPFCVGETGAWNKMSAWDGAAEALRPWYWEATLRGAGSFYYFRWRRSLMGEEDHPALLPHDGRPSRTLALVTAFRKEFRSVWEKLGDLPLPKTEVAIIYNPRDYQIGRAASRHTSAPHATEAYATMQRLHSALTRAGLCVDFLPTAEPERLKDYRLLFAPRMESVPDGFVEPLRERVRAGATLFAALRFNFREEWGTFRPETVPYRFTDVFGLTNRDIVKVGVRGTTREAEYKLPKPLPADYFPITAFGVRTTASFTMEEIEPRGCTVMETFSNGELKGLPLLTESSFGKGKAFYLATDLDPAGVDKAVEPALAAAGIASPVRLPEGVSRIVRGKYVFYCNGSPAEAAFATTDRGKALLGEGPKSGRLVLPAYGVTVLERL